MNTQVVDTLRFPYFNDPNTIGITYYTGWETGLSYFDGSPIDFMYEEIKLEIDAREKNETVHYGPDRYVEDCHILLKDQIPNYDPRCRPWYLKAWRNPGETTLTTYPALAFPNLWVTLAKTISGEDNKPTGVAAIDIDTAFLVEELTGEIFDGVQDFFLITVEDELVLYSYRTLKVDGGTPDKLITAEDYLFGPDSDPSEKAYFHDTI